MTMIDHKRDIRKAIGNIKVQLDYIQEILCEMQDDIDRKAEADGEEE